MERDFKGIWIPKEIWLAEDISPIEKILWAEIDSFTKNGGGCRAGNEYLSKFLKKSIPAINRYLANLRERGYIRGESFDGRKRIIKSINRDTADISEMIQQDDQKRYPSSNLSLLDNKEDNKDIYIDDSSEDFAQGNRSPLLPKPLKTRYLDAVHLTPKEHDKLVANYGPAQTDRLIEKLNNYKISKGKLYKSDYHAILVWVVDALKVQKIKNRGWECPKCGRINTHVGRYCLNPACGHESIEEGIGGSS